MRVVVVLVVRTPEERPNHRRRFYASEGQLQRPHHGHVPVFRQGDDLGHKCVFVCSIFLDTSYMPMLAVFLL
jgi:hypothetical protein